jgi:hypothetical protein
MREFGMVPPINIAEWASYPKPPPISRGRAKALLPIRCPRKGIRPLR